MADGSDTTHITASGWFAEYSPDNSRLPIVNPRRWIWWQRLRQSVRLTSGTALLVTGREQAGFSCRRVERPASLGHERGWNGKVPVVEREWSSAHWSPLGDKILFMAKSITASGRSALMEE
jgi:hypothetical protein